MELATTFIATDDFTLGQTARAYGKETKYELIKLLRQKSFILSIVGFPVMFFLLFGITNRAAIFHGHTVARYLLASYTGFGSMGAALFGIGAGLAQERGLGWLELKRASAMPTPAYLLSKLASAVVFGVAIALVLMAIGSAFVNLEISPAQAVHLILVIAGGVAVFASIGVFAGLHMPPRSAAGLINFIYLPLSLCGGMWLPIEALPGWLQYLAHFLPSYYYSRLALHALGYFQESELLSWSVLIGFGVVFSFASIWTFRRQSART